MGLSLVTQEVMWSCKSCIEAAAGRIVVRQAGSSGNLHSELAVVDSCCCCQENSNQLEHQDYCLSTW